MPSKVLTVRRDNNSRKKGNGTQKTGRGGATQIKVGKAKAANEITYLHHAVMDWEFPAGWWDDVEKVTAATLEFTVSATNAKARGVIMRRNKGWSAGSGTAWTAGEFVGDGGVATTTKRWYTPTTGRVSLDIRPFVRYWAPRRVYFDGIGNGQNGTNHGIQFSPSGKRLLAETFDYFSEDSGDPPTLVLTYEEVNRAPTATVSTPTGNVDPDFDITGTFSDPDAGQYQSAVHAQVRDSALNVIWDRSFTEWTGSWNVGGVPIALMSLGSYEVRARVRDSEGRWSAWTAWSGFDITTGVPTVTVIPVGQQVNMSGVIMQADFLIDASSEPCSKVDVQLQKQGGTWTTADLLWSDSYVPSQVEQDEHRVQTYYRGEGLPAGFYDWRVRVTDSIGGVSLWDTDTFELTVGQPDDPGDIDFTTGWANRQLQQRIVLYGINQSTRGPNGVIRGIVENPSNMGVMWNATAPGQLWFTLPTDHPQVSNIEPWVTHYQVEQYRRGAWQVLQYGLINDFDATGDEVVFLGVDYLGLLSYSTEIAVQPEENPKKNMGTSVKSLKGSRYFNKQIGVIVKDQLKRARFQEDYSPVRFVEIGSIASMPEKITIYAHYRQRLNFIRGLIDSHRGAASAGGEVRSRLRVAYKAGQRKHKFELETNAGKDRPNVELRYGSLLQNYQVVVMGDYLTRAHGVGYEPNASRPHFANRTAPGVDLKDWGNLSRPFEFVDVTDKKDLVRRTKHEATVGSRIGKSMALALRVTGLDPFDGYDILDSVPVFIQDGVVDTERYGSGYWTIWKVEWFVYPDGHDELRLTVRPKGDTTPVEPDLIPSDPIHFKTDWKWGHGLPPSTYDPET